MDESVEQEEEVIIENIPVEETAPTANETNSVKEESSKEGGSSSDPEVPAVVPSIQNKDPEDVVTRLTFEPVLGDSSIDAPKKEEMPKSLERLEEMSSSMAIQRKLEEEEDDDERIKISGDMIDLSGFDVLDDEKGIRDDTSDILLNDIEEL